MSKAQRPKIKMKTFTLRMPQDDWDRFRKKMKFKSSDNSLACHAIISYFAKE